VGSIAQATGFSSQFYFATRFNQAHGISPTRWRRQAVGHAGSDNPEPARWAADTKRRGRPEVEYRLSRP